MQKDSNIEIPLNILKNLSDKSSDKKKIGLKELEGFFRNCVNMKNESEIFRFIDTFKRQVYDQNPHLKKAAISGFSCISYSIKDLDNINPDIIKNLLVPILSSFKDNDPKTVLVAGEALYNFMLCHTNFVLKFFNEIFEGILSLHVNTDQEVRTIAQTLDSKLKEIINFAFQDNQNPQDFDLQEFFQKIIQKISTNHPGVKIFIVSWITFMDTIPEIRIFNVLPDFLPGLFSMLSERQKELNSASDKCLKEFLKELTNQFESLTYEIEYKILEILIDQCKLNHDSTKFTAFEWIHTFLLKYNEFLKNKSFIFTKRISLIRDKVSYSTNFSSNNKNLLGSSVSNSNNNFDLSLKHNSENIIQDPINIANSDNESQEQKVPFNLFPKILEIILMSVNNCNESISSLVYSFLKKAVRSNLILSHIIEKYTESSSMNIKLFEEVLKNNFSSNQVNTLEIVLNWINILFKKFNEEMFNDFESFIEKFANILNNNNYNIFNINLDLLCEIAKFKEENIEIIISKILEKLCLNKDLLNNKGLNILGKLCSILPVDRVYLTIAEALLRMKNIEFIGKMISILDIFLLTTKESECLRVILKKYRKNKDNSPNEKEFFEKIFTTWSFNPVSTLIICLISEYFELSYHLILKFGEIKLEQENYLQLAQLVQLLESAIFNNIRILLLEPIKNIYLVKTLYGILMLLPQGKAYQVLAKRMKNVEMLYKIDNDLQNTKQNEYNTDEVNQFLKIFENTQFILKQNCK